MADLCFKGVTACLSPLHFGGRTVLCARAVRTVGYFRPVFPDGPGDCGNYFVQIQRLLRFLLSPAIQVMSQNN